MQQDPAEVCVAFPVENKRAAWITTKLNSRLHMGGFALFVALMAYALAFAGDLFSLSPKIAAVLWPANAFQVAVMLLLPRRTWPLLITAHVVGGMIPLGILSIQALRGRIMPEATEYVGLYWHFVDLVWIFLFPLMYLI